jgi:hypothetical protein
MSLQGNLTDLPLIDLMQVLTLQNKTGILSVNRDFSQAQICFNQSRIYSAFSRHTGRHQHPVDYQGEVALYDLLSWPDGQFCFELTSSLPGVQNVNVTWNYIVLEYCRRQDELERQKEFERLAAQRPRLLPNPPVQAQITLDLEDWQVLLQVNNQLTLQEIASNIRFDLTQVIKITQKLAKQGLLEIDSTIPATQPVAVGAGAASWQVNPAQTPGWRNSPQAQHQPHYLPAERDNQVVHIKVAEGELRPTPARPQVQRGLLSGIMAKIRGL